MHLTYDIQCTIHFILLEINRICCMILFFFFSFYSYKKRNQLFITRLYSVCGVLTFTDLGFTFTADLMLITLVIIYYWQYVIDYEILDILHFFFFLMFYEWPFPYAYALWRLCIQNSTFDFVYIYFFFFVFLILLMKWLLQHFLNGIFFYHRLYLQIKFVINLNLISTVCRLIVYFLKK